MGARPLDFDENIVRQAPTFQKWESLATGQKLKYACRDFVKGHGDDEERLMRRIMIARRNNLRDHEILKRARAQTFGEGTEIPIGGPSTTTEVGGGKNSGDSGSVSANRAVQGSVVPSCAVPIAVQRRQLECEHDGDHVMVHSPPRAAPLNPARAVSVHIHRPDIVPSSGTKKRNVIVAFPMTDAEVLREMDGPAVEATRSYRAWLGIDDGAEFTYNQRYIKGRDGHDWLLRKNIWRRMRYRRENKRMVDKLKVDRGTDGVRVPLSMSVERCPTGDTIADNHNIPDNNTGNNTSININNINNNAKSPSATHNPNTVPQNITHAAVVQAAAAAVAAAESYVQEARESDTAALIASTTPTTHTMPPPPPPLPAVTVKIEHGVDNINLPPQGRTDGAAVGGEVHNPIIRVIGDRAHGGMVLPQGMNHTPNPLAGLHGNALDVAAKLAAAASVAVVEHARSTQMGEEEFSSSVQV